MKEPYEELEKKLKKTEHAMVAYFILMIINCFGWIAALMHCHK